MGGGVEKNEIVGTAENGVAVGTVGGMIYTKVGRAVADAVLVGKASVTGAELQAGNRTLNINRKQSNFPSFI